MSVALVPGWTIRSSDSMWMTCRFWTRTATISLSPTSAGLIFCTDLKEPSTDATRCSESFPSRHFLQPHTKAREAPLNMAAHPLCPRNSRPTRAGSGSPPPTDTPTVSLSMNMTDPTVAFRTHSQPARDSSAELARPPWITS